MMASFGNGSGSDTNLYIVPRNGWCSLFRCAATIITLLIAIMLLECVRCIMLYINNNKDRVVVWRNKHNIFFIVC